MAVEIRCRDPTAKRPRSGDREKILGPPKDTQRGFTSETKQILYRVFPIVIFFGGGNAWPFFVEVAETSGRIQFLVIVRGNPDLFKGIITRT